MRRSFLLLATTAVSAVAACSADLTPPASDRAGPSAAQNASAGQEVRDILFQIRADASAEALRRLDGVMHAFAMSRRASLVNGTVTVARIGNQNGNSEAGIARALEATGAVAFAEVDVLLEPTVVDPVTPSDTMLPLQWHHATIHSTAAWGVATGSPTVIAAVCDGGIDLTHVDLAANIHSPGYDLIDYTPNGDVTYDPLNPTSYTHGTKVGGMIGAVGNNVEGVTGVNWNVDLLAIKVTHNVTGSASLSKLVECVDYARSRGAKVVNQSFTGVAYSSANNAAGQALQAAGGLLVVAAGNDSLNRRTEKNYPYIIVVGGTDEADVKTAFSTYGPAIDLVAPAINLVTTRPTWRPTPYVMGDAGTSFASPIVAGVAALIFAARPDLTPATVQDILFKSAQDLGAAGVDNVYGNGRVDAGAALARALTAVNPVPGPGKKK